VCGKHQKPASEQQKYSSKEAQDQNLDMLIEWISDYEIRPDTFAKQAHQALYDNFTGVKTLISTNRNTENKMRLT